MPYSPTANTAQHALDEIQQIAAQKQYSWDEGLSPSLSSSSTAIETDLTAGTVVFDGETIPISSRTLTHPDGDPTNPRWDAICVVDEFGVTEVISGVPAEPITDTNGTVIRGESAFKPAPSDQVTDEMICLALVWIPAGATTNGDLTNQTAGGVAEPVIDRRIHQHGQVTHTTRRGVIGSSGWYRIAGVGPLAPSGVGGRASGLITIRDTQTGLHSSTTVSASCLYSDHALTLLNSSAFTEPHGAVEGVRIVSGSTNDGGAVDVNVQLGGQSTIDHAEYTIQNNYFPDGWEPVGWEPASVPSGYDTTVLDFSTANMMMGAVGNAGERNSFGVDHDGTVIANRIDKQETAARAWLSTNIDTTGSWTTVPFDQTNVDDWGAWNTSTGEFTVPYDGWFTVNGHIRRNGILGGTRLDTAIALNGTHRAISRFSVGDFGPATLSVSDTISLSQGDTVAIDVQHEGTETIPVAGSALETYCTVVYEG